MATELSALNVKIGGDASGLEASVNSAKQELDGLSKSAANAGTKTSGMSAGFNSASNASNLLKRNATNVSYQLQDVAVQLQMGTKASTVFAQQLPQLASGFGPVGAAIGLLAAVGIPALAFAFKAAEGSGRDFSDILKDLEDNVGTVSSAISASREPLSKIAQSYGTATAEALKFLDAEIAIAQFKAFESLNEAIKSLSKTFLSMAPSFSEFSDFDKQVQVLTDDFHMSESSAIALTDAMRNMNDAKGAEAQAAASLALKDVIDSIYATQQDMPEEVRKLYEQLVQSGKAALQLANAGSTYSDDLKAQEDSLKNITKLNETIAKQLAAGVVKDTGEDAWLIRAKGMEEAAQRQADMDAAEAEAAAKKEEDDIARAERYVERLIAKNATELELAASQKEQLDAMRAENLISEEEYANAIDALEERKAKVKLGMAKSALSDVASLMQSENKKAFAIGKAAALANATIDGISAAIAAWDAGMSTGGPYAPAVAAAYTAASLAKTGAMISSIASQSIGGGSASAGAAAAAGGAETTAPAVQTSQNVAISLTGDTFGRDQVLTLINSINEAVDDGAVIRVV